jgi:predicted metal-dependent hydrolase
VEEQFSGRLKTAARPFFARNARYSCSKRGRWFAFPDSIFRRTPLAKAAVGFENMLNFFGRTPKRTVNEIEIAFRGATYRIALKRIATARRLTLRVRAATRDIVLTMPMRAGVRQAQEFAQNHAEWIAERLERLPQRLPFEPGARIFLRDVEHELLHCPDRSERRGVVWLDQRDGAPVLCAGGDPAHFERRIADFLRREARRDLEQAVRSHAAAVGRAPIALSLRDTSSRWGSCSAKGALNFSWRLIMAPPFVLDYLAAHETAHLRHHDHSDRFWALTKSLCPRTEQAEGWLKAHGAKLHRYGRRSLVNGREGVSAE